MTAKNSFKLTRKLISLDDRLQKAQQNTGNKSNCFGTAFYLAGLRDVEKYFRSRDGKLFVENSCCAIDEAVHDSFITVIWRYRPTIMEHAGYVFERESKLMLAHRPYSGVPFQQLPLEDYLNSEELNAICEGAMSEGDIRIQYYQLPEVENA